MAKSTLNTSLLAALSHPLRIEIVRRCVEPASPKEIADDIGENLGNVSYHTRILAAAGVLELERTEPRRGALAHYYVVPKEAQKAMKVASRDLAKLADLF